MEIKKIELSLGRLAISTELIEGQLAEEFNTLKSLKDLHNLRTDKHKVSISFLVNHVCREAKEHYNFFHNLRWWV